jgi:hypothetical protein
MTKKSTTKNSRKRAAPHKKGTRSLIREAAATALVLITSPLLAVVVEKVASAVPAQPALISASETSCIAVICNMQANAK